MTPRQREQRARYARRRRAALPSALAAFVMLVVVTSSNVPASFAGATVPSLTVVLPPQLVAAVGGSSDGGGSGGGGSGSGGGSSDTSPSPAPSGDGSQQPTSHHDRSSHEGGTTPVPVKVHHVFLIVLADTNLTALTADPVPPATTPAAPYLKEQLLPKGTLLTRYAAVARGAVANGVALLSGQGPTAQTLADCPTYADVAPDQLGADGQQLGDGCVYPFETGTLIDELHGAGLDGRAYVEDLGAGAPDPAHPAAVTCRHPAPGAADDATAPQPGDAYVTRRNPVVFFHSLLDTGACARDDVSLDALDANLAAGKDAPAFAYIVPSRCHDGSATPCAPGAPAGPAAADAFLATLVPKILASPAYADGGMLVITSDEPPPPPALPAGTPVPPTTTTTTPTTTRTTAVQATTTPAPTTTATTPTTPTTATTPTPPVMPPPAPTCCVLHSYPNVGSPIAAGAGFVGALLIGPGVQAGATDDAPASHFTLLRAVEDLFALQPLGYAGSSELTPLPERVLPALAHASASG